MTPNLHNFTETIYSLHSVTKRKPSCDGWACIAEMEVVYDPVTKTCGCSWIPGFGPSAYVKPSSHIRDPTSDANIKPSVTFITHLPPPTARPPISPCATILCAPGYYPVANTTNHTCKCVPKNCLPKIVCISEKQPVFNPTTSECECEWRPEFGPLISDRETIVEPITKPDPKPICLAKCTVGYHSVQYPDGSCGCVKDAEPLPCAIRCIPQYTLVTDLDTGECKCEPGPDYTPCHAKCAEGYYWVEGTKERLGRCVKNAAPLPCPIRCTNTSVLFFSPQTGKCSCIKKDRDCLDNTHFLEGPSVWNSTTETCTCLDESKRKEELCLLATSCVVGSQPVWDSIKKVCTCEPNPTGPEFICLAATTCIIGSIPVWDGTSQTCRCVET